MPAWQWEKVDAESTQHKPLVWKLNERLLRLAHFLKPLDGLIGPNGQVWVGDVSNANNTFGLTLNQLAADDHIITLKSSDVATGLTSALTPNVETDDFFYVAKRSATLGGVIMTAMAEDDALNNPLAIRSFGGTADTTKSTAGRALVEVYAAEHDGANAVADVTADGNVWAVRCRRGSADVALLIVDEDADAWLGASFTHLGRLVSTFQTFGANDATPSVAAGKNFATANANPTTVTAFDDGVNGQEIFVKIADANTTIDFTGTTLKGNAGVDWVPTSGDFMRCTHDGTNWLCSVHEA